MLRREDHERRTPQRVGTSSKDFNRVSGLSVENNRGAFASSDPICLQSFDAFGPINAIKIQQLVGILCRFEEPLFQILFYDRSATTFTNAVFANHLFACEGSIIFG